MNAPNSSRAAAAYAAQRVLTAPPARIVKMLLDKALVCLGQARTALAAGEPARSAEAVGRAGRILMELRASLDWERGGEITANLDRIYGFVLSRIARATLTRTDAPLAEAETVLQPIKEAWDGVCEPA